MSDRESLDASILASWRVVARALDRFMLPRLVELGVTMPQFKALIAVASAGTGGVSVTQLGTELAVGQPSASLIVDQLVRLGYVVRVPDETDRRRVLVVATAKGLETTHELREGRRTNFFTMLANVRDDDAASLDVGLKALALSVEAAAAARRSR